MASYLGYLTLDQLISLFWLAISSFAGHVQLLPLSTLLNGSSKILKRLYFGCVTLIPVLLRLRGTYLVLDDSSTTAISSLTGLLP